VQEQCEPEGGTASAANRSEFFSAMPKISSSASSRKLSRPTKLGDLSRSYSVKASPKVMSAGIATSAVTPSR
jgi:hypothetical protein